MTQHLPAGHYLALKMCHLVPLVSFFKNNMSFRTSLFCSVSAVASKVPAELGADAAREVRVQGQRQRGRAA